MRTAKKTKVPAKKPQTNNRGSNTLRIIGGEWRSRKLQFIDAPGLRPTPDRIRETLFNWLQGKTHNANCLDLFAGSGALGLEALSRGAKNVVFIEKNAVIANKLKENLALLKADAAVIISDALSYINNETKAKEVFDVIFLDPPYRLGLIEKSLSDLIEKKLLNESTLIYLEHEEEESFDWAEFGLVVLKQASAGQVKSFLVKQIDSKTA